MSDHKILAIVALLFAWLLSKFIKFSKFSNSCILNHDMSCLKRRKKSKRKYRQAKFPYVLKRNGEGNKKVLNFKRELRILNEIERLIDTITETDNPECSLMISNHYFACNFVSSPIGSILNKLRQMEKNGYCCKKDVVDAKIHNLMLKLTFLIL